MKNAAQVVDAVDVVGMLVGVEHAVEPIDVGVEKLLAQIGRRIHQDPRDTAVVVALDEQCSAPAAVFRIGRIADAPAQRRPRHAAGRPAAEDRELQRHAAAAAVRGTLLNRRKKFSVVCRAISSNETPRVSASTFAVSTT